MSSGRNATTEVRNLIREHNVVCFSKSYCGYSMKAKRALANYALNGYKVIEIDEMDPDLAASYMDELQRCTNNARTVPKVFIAGNFIGGGSETQDLHQSGKLRDLLSDAHALAMTEE